MFQLQSVVLLCLAVQVVKVVKWPQSQFPAQGLALVQWLVLERPQLH